MSIYSCKSLVKKSLVLILYSLLSLCDSQASQTDSNIAPVSESSTTLQEKLKNLSHAKITELRRQYNIEQQEIDKEIKLAKEKLDRVKKNPFSTAERIAKAQAKYDTADEKSKEFAAKNFEPVNRERIYDDVIKELPLNVFDKYSNVPLDPTRPETDQVKERFQTAQDTLDDKQAAFKVAENQKIKSEAELLPKMKAYLSLPKDQQQQYLSELREPKRNYKTALQQYVKAEIERDQANQNYNEAKNHLEKLVSVSTNVTESKDLGQITKVEDQATGKTPAKDSKTITTKLMHRAESALQTLKQTLNRKKLQKNQQDAQKLYEGAKALESKYNRQTSKSLDQLVYQDRLARSLNTLTPDAEKEYGLTQETKIALGFADDQKFLITKANPNALLRTRIYTSDGKYEILTSKDKDNNLVFHKLATNKERFDIKGYVEKTHPNISKLEPENLAETINTNKKEQFDIKGYVEKTDPNILNLEPKESAQTIDTDKADRNSQIMIADAAVKEKVQKLYQDYANAADQKSAALSNYRAKLNESTNALKQSTNPSSEPMDFFHVKLRLDALKQKEEDAKKVNETLDKESAAKKLEYEQYFENHEKQLALKAGSLENTEQSTFAPSKLNAAQQKNALYVQHQALNGIKKIKDYTQKNAKDLLKQQNNLEDKIEKKRQKLAILQSDPTKKAEAAVQQEKINYLNEQNAELRSKAVRAQNDYLLARESYHQTYLENVSKINEYAKDSLEIAKEKVEALEQKPDSIEHKVAAANLKAAELHAKAAKTRFDNLEQDKPLFRDPRDEHYDNFIEKDAADEAFKQAQTHLAAEQAKLVQSPADPKLKESVATASKQLIAARTAKNAINTTYHKAKLAFLSDKLKNAETQVQALEKNFEPTIVASDETKAKYTLNALNNAEAKVLPLKEYLDKNSTLPGFIEYEKAQGTAYGTAEALKKYLAVKDQSPSFIEYAAKYQAAVKERDTAKQLHNKYISVTDDRNDWKTRYDKAYYHATKDNLDIEMKKLNALPGGIQSPKYIADSVKVTGLAVEHGQATINYTENTLRDAENTIPALRKYLNENSVSPGFIEYEKAQETAEALTKYLAVKDQSPSFTEYAAKYQTAFKDRDDAKKRYEDAKNNQEKLKEKQQITQAVAEKRAAIAERQAKINAKANRESSRKSNKTAAIVSEKIVPEDIEDQLEEDRLSNRSINNSRDITSQLEPSKRDVKRELETAKNNEQILKYSANNRQNDLTKSQQQFSEEYIEQSIQKIKSLDSQIKSLSANQEIDPTTQSNQLRALKAQKIEIQNDYKVKKDDLNRKLVEHDDALNKYELKISERERLEYFLKKGVYPDKTPTELAREERIKLQDKIVSGGDSNSANIKPDDTTVNVKETDETVNPVSNTLKTSQSKLSKRDVKIELENVKNREQILRYSANNRQKDFIESRENFSAEYVEKFTKEMKSLDNQINSNTQPEQLKSLQTQKAQLLNDFKKKSSDFKKKLAERNNALDEYESKTSERERLEYFLKKGVNLDKTPTELAREERIKLQNKTLSSAELDSPNKKLDNAIANEKKTLDAVNKISNALERNKFELKGLKKQKNNISLIKKLMKSNRQENKILKAQIQQKKLEQQKLQNDLKIAEENRVIAASNWDDVVSNLDAKDISQAQTVKPKPEKADQASNKIVPDGDLNSPNTKLDKKSTLIDPASQVAKIKTNEPLAVPIKKDAPITIDSTGKQPNSTATDPLNSEGKDEAKSTELDKSNSLTKKEADVAAKKAVTQQAWKELDGEKYNYDHTPPGPDKQTALDRLIDKKTKFLDSLNKFNNANIELATQAKDENVKGFMSPEAAIASKQQAINYFYFLDGQDKAADARAKQVEAQQAKSPNDIALEKSLSQLKAAGQDADSASDALLEANDKMAKITDHLIDQGKLTRPLRELDPEDAAKYGLTDQAKASIGIDPQQKLLFGPADPGMRRRAVIYTADGKTEIMVRDAFGKPVINKLPTNMETFKVGDHTMIAAPETQQLVRELHNNFEPIRQRNIAAASKYKDLRDNIQQQLDKAKGANSLSDTENPYEILDRQASGEVLDQKSQDILKKFQDDATSQLKDIDVINPERYKTRKPSSTLSEDENNNFDSIASDLKKQYEQAESKYGELIKQQVEEENLLDQERLKLASLQENPNIFDRLTRSTEKITAQQQKIDQINQRNAVLRPKVLQAKADNIAIREKYHDFIKLKYDTNTKMLEKNSKLVENSKLALFQIKQKYGISSPEFEAGLEKYQGELDTFDRNKFDPTDTPYEDFEKNYKTLNDPMIEPSGPEFDGLKKTAEPDGSTSPATREINNGKITDEPKAEILNEAVPDSVIADSSGKQSETEAQITDSTSQESTLKTPELNDLEIDDHDALLKNLNEFDTIPIKSDNDTKDITSSIQQQSGNSIKQQDPKPESVNQNNETPKKFDAIDNEKRVNSTLNNVNKSTEEPNLPKQLEELNKNIASEQDKLQGFADKLGDLNNRDEDDPEFVKANKDYDKQDKIVDDLKNQAKEIKGKINTISPQTSTPKDTANLESKITQEPVSNTSAKPDNNVKETANIDQQKSINSNEKRNLGTAERIVQTQTSDTNKVVNLTPQDKVNQAELQSRKAQSEVDNLSGQLEKNKAEQADLTKKIANLEKQKISSPFKRLLKENRDKNKDLDNQIKQANQALTENEQERTNLDNKRTIAVDNAKKANQAFDRVIEDNREPTSEELQELSNLNKQVNENQQKLAEQLKAQALSPTNSATLNDASKESNQPDNIQKDTKSIADPDGKLPANTENTSDKQSIKTTESKDNGGSFGKFKNLAGKIASGLEDAKSSIGRQASSIKKSLSDTILKDESLIVEGPKTELDQARAALAQAHDDITEHGSTPALEENYAEKMKNFNKIIEKIKAQEEKEKSDRLHAQQDSDAKDNKDKQDANESKMKSIQEDLSNLNEKLKQDPQSRTLPDEINNKTKYYDELVKDNKRLQIQAQEIQKRKDLLDRRDSQNSQIKANITAAGSTPEPKPEPSNQTPEQNPVDKAGAVKQDTVVDDKKIDDDSAESKKSVQDQPPEVKDSVQPESQDKSVEETKIQPEKSTGLWDKIKNIFTPEKPAVKAVTSQSPPLTSIKVPKEDEPTVETNKLHQQYVEALSDSNKKQDIKNKIYNDKKSTTVEQKSAFEDSKFAEADAAKKRDAYFLSAFEEKAKKADNKIANAQEIISSTDPESPEHKKALSDLESAKLDKNMATENINKYKSKLNKVADQGILVPDDIKDSNDVKQTVDQFPVADQKTELEQAKENHDNAFEEANSAYSKLISIPEDDPQHQDAKKDYEAKLAAYENEGKKVDAVEKTQAAKNAVEASQHKESEETNQNIESSENNSNPKSEDINDIKSLEPKNNTLDLLKIKPQPLASPVAKPKTDIEQAEGDAKDQALGQAYKDAKEKIRDTEDFKDVVNLDETSTQQQKVAAKKAYDFAVLEHEEAKQNLINFRDSKDNQQPLSKENQKATQRLLKKRAALEKTYKNKEKQATKADADKGHTAAQEEQTKVSNDPKSTDATIPKEAKYRAITPLDEAKSNQEFAEQRLAIAKQSKDLKNIKLAQEHLEYWNTKLQEETAKDKAVKKAAAEKAAPKPAVLSEESKAKIATAQKAVDESEEKLKIADSFKKKALANPASTEREKVAAKQTYAFAELRNEEAMQKLAKVESVEKGNPEQLERLTAKDKDFANRKASLKKLYAKAEQKADRADKKAAQVKAKAEQAKQKANDKAAADKKIAESNSKSSNTVESKNVLEKDEKTASLQKQLSKLREKRRLIKAFGNQKQLDKNNEEIKKIDNDIKQSKIEYASQARRTPSVFQQVTANKPVVSDTKSATPSDKAPIDTKASDTTEPIKTAPKQDFDTLYKQYAAEQDTIDASDKKLADLDKKVADLDKLDKEAARIPDPKAKEALAQEYAKAKQEKIAAKSRQDDLKDKMTTALAGESDDELKSRQTQAQQEEVAAEQKLESLGKAEETSKESIAAEKDLDEKTKKLDQINDLIEKSKVKKAAIAAAKQAASSDKASRSNPSAEDRAKAIEDTSAKLETAEQNRDTAQAVFNSLEVKDANDPVVITAKANLANAENDVKNLQSTLQMQLDDNDKINAGQDSAISQNSSSSSSSGNNSDDSSQSLSDSKTSSSSSSSDSRFDNNIAAQTKSDNLAGNNTASDTSSPSSSSSSSSASLASQGDNNIANATGNNNTGQPTESQSSSVGGLQNNSGSDTSSPSSSSSSSSTSQGDGSNNIASGNQNGSDQSSSNALSGNNNATQSSSQNNGGVSESQGNANTNGNAGGLDQSSGTGNNVSTADNNTGQQTGSQSGSGGINQGGLDQNGSNTVSGNNNATQSSSQNNGGVSESQGNTSSSGNSSVSDQGGSSTTNTGGNNSAAQPTESQSSSVDGLQNNTGSDTSNPSSSSSSSSASPASQSDNNIASATGQSSGSSNGNQSGALSNSPETPAAAESENPVSTQDAIKTAAGLSDPTLDPPTSIVDQIKNAVNNAIDQIKSTLGFNGSTETPSPTNTSTTTTSGGNQTTVGGNPSQTSGSGDQTTVGGSKEGSVGGNPSQTPGSSSTEQPVEVDPSQTPGSSSTEQPVKVDPSQAPGSSTQKPVGGGNQTPVDGGDQKPVEVDPSQTPGSNTQKPVEVDPSQTPGSNTQKPVEVDPSQTPGSNTQKPVEVDPSQTPGSSTQKPVGGGNQTTVSGGDQKPVDGGKTTPVAVGTETPVVDNPSQTPGTSNQSSLNGGKESSVSGDQSKIPGSSNQTTVSGGSQSSLSNGIENTVNGSSESSVNGNGSANDLSKTPVNTVTNQSESELPKTVVNPVGGSIEAPVTPGPAGSNFPTSTTPPVETPTTTPVETPTTPIAETAAPPVNTGTINGSEPNLSAVTDTTASLSDTAAPKSGSATTSVIEGVGALAGTMALAEGAQFALKQGENASNQAGVAATGLTANVAATVLNTPNAAALGSSTAASAFALAQEGLGEFALSPLTTNFTAIEAALNAVEAPGVPIVDLAANLKQLGILSGLGGQTFVEIPNSNIYDALLKLQFALGTPVLDIMIPFSAAIEMNRTYVGPTVTNPYSIINMLYNIQTSMTTGIAPEMFDLSTVAQILTFASEIGQGVDMLLNISAGIAQIALSYEDFNASSTNRDAMAQQTESWAKMAELLALGGMGTMVGQSLGMLLNANNTAKWLNLSETEVNALAVMQAGNELIAINIDHTQNIRGLLLGMYNVMLTVVAQDASLAAMKASHSNKMIAPAAVAASVNSNNTNNAVRY